MSGPALLPAEAVVVLPAEAVVVIGGDDGISPHQEKKGPVLMKLQQYREEAIAKREGCCVECGIKTHQVILSPMGRRKMNPLTNEKVHDGVCIGCNYRSGPIRIVDGHVFVEIPKVDAKGRLLTMEEKETIATRKGCCVKCGIKTHEVIKSLWQWKMNPLTNKKVHDGVCIGCNDLHRPRRLIDGVCMAKREGCCDNCGIRTHRVTVALLQRKMDPLTNDEVHKGTCIKCNTHLVPTKVKEDWASNLDNPRVRNVQRLIPDRLRNDRDYVLRVCSENGFLLAKASPQLQDDKEVVLAAVSHTESAIRFASERLRKDKEVFLRAHQHRPIRLSTAPNVIRNCEDIVMAACCDKDGRGIHQFEFASKALRKDKKVVLEVCSYDGNALQFASESLRSDKDAVMTSVKSRPESLKFALGGLNQDKDCLIAAGLWDKNYEKAEAERKDIVESPKRVPTNEKKPDRRKKKIVLSTKFSLAHESSPHATKFTVELKKHPYIAKKFLVYSPNAFNKGTCDPNWTDSKWPCRGTYETCQKPSHLKTGVPQEADCCWRYSFRYHLQDAFRGGGVMIQVIDKNAGGGHTMGEGQRIEHQMAPAVGIKTFRFYEPIDTPSYADRVSKLVYDIQKWSFAQGSGRSSSRGG